MESASLKHLALVIDLGLFILTAMVVYRQLHNYHLGDILRQVHAIPSGRTREALL